MARFSQTSEDGIPQLFKAAADYNDHYVDESWNGKHVYIYDMGNWDAIWIAPDSALNLPIGFTFTIVTQGAYVYLNAVDTNNTILSAVSVPYTSNGYDIDVDTMVTVMKIDSDRWICSGYGITQD